MRRRNITSKLIDAIQDTPVVFLRGARQTGKSTLARHLVEEGYFEDYVTLDEATVLAAAGTNAQAFIDGLRGRVVVDEVQRAPDIFLAIKRSVDKDRRPGRFLLTGSADILLLPHVSESLAGRIEIITLLPFSQGEMAGRDDRFVDAVFGDDLPESALDRVLTSGESEAEPDLLGRALRGGYPEVLTRHDERRRRSWFESYITTMLQRDVRDLAAVDRISDLPRLLQLVAARTAGLVNYAEISRASGLPQTTLKRYLTLLESTFLLWEIPAYSTNISKRLVRSPKLMLGDSGLAAHLSGITRDRLITQRHLLGPLLETFVATELRKQISWSAVWPSLYHFRTQTGQEVDLVLEAPDGRLVGIEVKASGSVTEGDFKGLRALAEQQAKFVRGIVLYDGDRTVHFEDRMIAVPFPALWTW